MTAVATPPKSEHVKAAKAAAKRAKSGSSEKKTSATKPDRYELEEQRRAAERLREQAERARWTKALPQLRAALAEKVRTAPTGPTSVLGAAVLKECQGWSWENGWAKNVIPLGRTAEDVVRRAAWLVLTKDLNQHRAISSAAGVLKRFGIDAAKIVDQVAPKPKQPATKKATKGARK